MQNGKSIPIRTEDFLSRTPAKLAAIRAALREEYEKRHNQPWIVAYSGGKDSTLLLQMIFETVLASETRRRQVHIVANDTQVESPPVIDHLNDSIAAIRKAIGARDLPMSATITKPYTDQTFWVNVIGRGYIPPTRNFRWCTDRLKIQPTTDFIKRLTRTHKSVILLLGTRKAESSARKRRMENHARQSRGRMNPHSQIENCRIFSPLAELSDNEVWAVLLQTRPPWGGTHRRLITLYRNAGGGEDFLKPLREFRKWLWTLRKDDENRVPILRNGATKRCENGTLVRGAFKIRVRRQILKELRKMENEIGRSLVSLGELRMIEEFWRLDAAQYACHDSLAKLFGGALCGALIAA